MNSQGNDRKIVNIVYKLAEVIAAVFFILMCLSVSIQVTARYLFNITFGWGEELPIFLFLWVSFVSAAVAYRDGSHLSVDFIVSKFNRKVRFAIYYINLALSLVFVFIILYYETLMTLSTRKSTFVVLKISKAYCYVGIPFSCALFALFILEKLLVKRPVLPEEEKQIIEGQEHS
ncbi:MAG: TRAP transporter small permease [Desulfohalobiaceae bacterium]|nr:TRAP transporter small permease [Desulfohalobiaceae bacterium]